MTGTQCPDLTLLAMAAYEAIKKGVRDEKTASTEKTQKKETLHAAG